MKKKLLIISFFAGSLISGFAQNQLPVNGKFQLLPLPYATSALSPHIGTETMETHWGKHVQTYIDNVNDLVKDTEYEGLSLEQVVRRSSNGKLYNNAAQVWNHNLFFSILSPNPKKQPTGNLANAINRQYGSFNAFKEAFDKAGNDVFGSGWTWLLKRADGSIFIKTTPNGDCPLEEGLPLIALDVWEHAYYLDYKNKKADYIDAFWNVLNWQAVEERYGN